jgi:3-oxoacyl-[acyl-carrier protein] reductase
MPAPRASLTPVAVVTGSSSGIGRATALRLGRAGYAVVLHARSNLAGLQEVARQLQSAQLQAAQLQSAESSAAPRVLCLTGDIACPQTCHDLVAAAFGWRGRVDAWVNNAGADVLTGGGRQQAFEARLQRLLEVDVQGTVRLSRLVAPRMAGQTAGVPVSEIPVAGVENAATQASPLPCIINMGWDQAALGMEGEPGQLFGTTKAAIAAFSSSLALSYPSIRVNCVAPGWIQTEWGQTSANGYWAQRAVDESLQRRWGTADDVAQAIAWLVSDSSRFVNGQTVAVNGGRRYYPH